ncbi:MAG TPA: hypothetical protein EYH07_18280 [Kiloniellaceae bacterium]|nr:hypothetical protein [Kiloniellaceae bacterium]HIP80393.1 hypothetical protein [Kiloniellaceae bacterium]
MSGLTRVFGEAFDVGCTVDIENTFDSCHAHVELDGNLPIHPGDAVRVQGDPVVVPYGAKLILRRRANVRRAGALKRLWTRLGGNLECLDLFEVSFSSGSKL